MKKDKKYPPVNPEEIKDLTKDEVKGKRNPNQKKKEYDRKYSGEDSNWN
jgi:hypothetical protein